MDPVVKRQLDELAKSIDEKIRKAKAKRLRKRERKRTKKESENERSEVS